MRNKRFGKLLSAALAAAMALSLSSAALAAGNGETHLTIIGTSRGAWIEIIIALAKLRAAICRTPRGVRGLKYIDTLGIDSSMTVAPLAGCVD